MPLSNQINKKAKPGMADIHPTAIIEDGAEIHDTARIGPFCIVGPHVRVGANVYLHSNVVLAGKAIIEENCELFNNATVGMRAQSIGASDKPTVAIIGARTILRENVSVNGASPDKDEPTKIGCDCYFMINTHIGHDCRIGNKCVLAPGVMVGGHSRVADQVWIGGGSAIHQNSWIGEHCFVGAGSILTGDVVPFATTAGNHAKIETINAVGLTRRGFGRADLKEIRGVIKCLFQKDGRSHAEKLKEANDLYSESKHASKVLEFVESPRSGRSLCSYRG